MTLSLFNLLYSNPGRIYSRARLMDFFIRIAVTSLLPQLVAISEIYVKDPVDNLNRSICGAG